MKIKESIHIKNLGPIVDIHIPDVKPLTVLIGESAGGKSAVMKALILCRWIYKMCNLREYLHNSGVLRSPFRFRLNRHLEYVGLQEYVHFNTEICYTVSFGNEKDLQGDAEMSYNIDIKNKQRIIFSGTIPPEALCYEKLCYIPETRGLIPHALGVIGRRPAYQALIDEMIENFQYASSALPELNIACLGVKFMVKRSSSIPEYKVLPLDEKKGKYDIKFRHSSSGIQNTVPLLLLMAYFSKHFDLRDAFKKTVLTYVMDSENWTNFKPLKDWEPLAKHAKIFLHLEEPELGLFPDAQCDLMNEIVKYCFDSSGNPTNLILTTHSPYILNQLNLLIQAHDKKNTEHTDGACLNYDDIAAYHVEAGGIGDLKNITERRLINTDALSDTMDLIYNRYEALM